MKRFRICFVLVSLLLIVSLTLTACSQDTPVTPADDEEVDEVEETDTEYPERPINCIVGFSPGGPTDVIARGIVPILQEKLDVGIAITNTPGAASATAAANVLEQPSDGYTLFFGSEIMSVWQTMDTMDLSPTKDFIPIKLVSEAIPALAVPPDSPFNTAEEFIQHVLDNPGKVTVGTAGPATVPHISGLLLEQQLGCKFNYVPFQGGGPAITAVMGGQVDATIEMVQSMVEAHKAGNLKILASFTNEPIEGLDDIVPIGTIYEKLQDYIPYGPYFGLFASKDTPQEVISVLEEAMNESMADPRWDEYCENLHLVQIDYDGEEAIKYLDEWTSKAAWLLFDMGGAKKSPEDFGIKRLD